jgi:hypothetical protein
MDRMDKGLQWTQMDRNGRAQERNPQLRLKLEKRLLIPNLNQIECGFFSCARPFASISVYLRPLKSIPLSARSFA